MQVIHNEGIIHNDLKPENFVCIHGRLKLIDFGIANRISDEHTSVERNLRCGTINYMSPETIETHEDNDFFKVYRKTLCKSALVVCCRKTLFVNAALLVH